MAYEDADLYFADFFLPDNANLIYYWQAKQLQ